MMLRYSGVSLDNDNTDDTFELLEQSKTGQTSTLASFSNDWTNQSSRLSARILSLQSTTHAVCSAFWMGLLTFVTVVGFSVLASDIWCFLLGAQRSDLLSKSASCDLQI